MLLLLEPLVKLNIILKKQIKVPEHLDPNIEQTFDLKTQQMRAELFQIALGTRHKEMVLINKINNLDEQ